jgi:hypothetical protein
MSEQSGGPGWWQASDGKWYPPEQAPTAAQPAVDPTTTPPAYGAPAYGPPAYGAPAAGAAAGGGGAGKVIAIVVVLALLAGGGAFLLTRGSGGGGSEADFCAKATAVRDISFEDIAGAPARIDSVLRAFDELAKAAPKEIKNDANTLNDAAKRAAKNVSAGKQPSDGFTDSDTTKLTNAVANVASFATQKCGPGTSSSSNSDSSFSFSFDSSAFESSLSERSSDFSTFDDSSFSSELSSLCDSFGSDFPGCS